MAFLEIVPSTHATFRSVCTYESAPLSGPGVGFQTAWDQSRDCINTLRSISNEYRILGSGTSMG
eukprot:3685951-Rhodomonas_salina.1